MSLLAVGLMLGAFVGTSQAAVEVVNNSTYTTWPNTIYYMAHLSGPNAPYDSLDVQIAAAEKYKLWINGKRVQAVGQSLTDADWNVEDGMTFQQYKIDDIETTPGNGKDIIIGVEVFNTGNGIGNGLCVDIKAYSTEVGIDWLGTSTMQRNSAIIQESRKILPVKWYYYSGDITSQSWAVAPWYSLKYNPARSETFLTDATVLANIRPVLKGNAEFVGFLPNEKTEIVTGYVGDVDLATAAAGGIQLRRIEGENLALKKPAQEWQLTDGDPTYNVYPYSADPLGTSRYVDLEKMYRISRYVLYTGDSNPDNWEDKSVRGFAVEISYDKFRWEEVNVIHEVGITNKDNGGFDYAIVDFPEEWARYVRYRITEPRDVQPSIGEVMVYGVGYTYNGEYESDWIDFSSTEKKNFKSVKWEGTSPEGTSIKVQTKTRYINEKGDPVESDWSQEYTVKEFTFDSPEPATEVKYKVKLTTQDINKTPILSSIEFSYSETAQPVTEADGFIFPNLVPMGVDADFVYTMSFKIADGQKIKQVRLATPSYAKLDSVFFVDVLASGAPTRTGYAVDAGVTDNPTPEYLDVVFTNPITSTGGTAADSLYVKFSAKLIKNMHNFKAWIYNDATPMNDDAGGVGVWENQALGSWTVLTSSIISGVLSNVKASPKVFTPDPDGSGDGINDFTVFEFSLAKITADIKVKVYDTKGSLVTQVHPRSGDPDKLDPRDWFIPDAEKLGAASDAMNLPGYWDGKDEDGDLVPPGVYIFQVIADTDDGEKIESGTVVVAY